MRSGSGSDSAPSDVRLLRQPMARGGAEVQSVEGAESLDRPKRSAGEGALAFEGVQHDALQQVPQGHLVVRRQGLQDPEYPPLDPDPGLNPLDGDLRCVALLHGTNVPRYQLWAKRRKNPGTPASTPASPHTCRRNRTMQGRL